MSYRHIVGKLDPYTDAELLPKSVQHPMLSLIATNAKEGCAAPGPARRDAQSARLVAALYRRSAVSLSQANLSQAPQRPSNRPCMHRRIWRVRI